MDSKKHDNGSNTSLCIVSVVYIEEICTCAYEFAHVKVVAIQLGFHFPLLINPLKKSDEQKSLLATIYLSGGNFIIWESGIRESQESQQSHYNTRILSGSHYRPNVPNCPKMVPKFQIQAKIF